MEENTRIRFKNLGSAVAHAFFHGGWIASSRFTSAEDTFAVWYSPSSLHTMSYIMNDIRCDRFDVGTYGFYKERGL